MLSCTGKQVVWKRSSRLWLDHIYVSILIAFKSKDINAPAEEVAIPSQPSTKWEANASSLGQPEAMGLLPQ
jgi:hypothetical protein